jgi:hypothetical protein
VITALVLLLLLADATSPILEKSMAPAEIYERCVAAMNANGKPAYAVYMLHVDAQHIDITRGYTSTGSPTTELKFGTFVHTSTYRVWYRAHDQKSLTQDLGSETTALTPPVPWALDLVGPPASPQNSSNESVGAGGAAIDQATQLLSEIYTNERDAYHISLVGMEEYGGHRVYHLDLENVGGDPNDHALRTLLVDSNSFRPLQVVVEVAQRSMMYGGGLIMSANFSEVGGYWLSTSGSVTGYGHFAFIHVQGTYTYTASDFTFPATLPDSMFSH